MNQASYWLPTLLAAAVGLAVVFLVLVGLFLLFRAFWLWYWKLDRIAADIETANELLAQIRDLLRARERER